MVELSSILRKLKVMSRKSKKGSGAEHSPSGKEEVEHLIEKEMEVEREAAFKLFISAPLSSSATTFLRQKGIKVVESYPLYEPWAKAYIVESLETKRVTYLVDEIPLNEQEIKVFNEIMDVLSWQMKYVSGEPELIRREFINQAKDVIFKYRIRLGRTPGILWSKILYYVERETIGFGPIDPLIKDPNIEDISCDGIRRPVYVWHRRYEYIPTNVFFNDEDELNSFLLKLAHKAGKHLSVAFPILDAILPGGHRVAATYSREVSTSGSTFTIRKFREDPITIADLIAWRTLSPDIAAYLWMSIEHKMTGLILGVTGAGKTSMLNALATLLRPTVKVVTIEDTPELKLPIDNWVQLVSRPSYGLGSEKIGEVSLYDLIKVALRYRPDVIIVGEVRGEEAYVLFQAIATGHGGITTMHAEHIDAAVKRLTSPPMNIPPSYIPLMNFALVIRRVQIGEKIARRITNVWEVEDYGKYIEVAKWIPSRDEFELDVGVSSLLKDYAMWRGWEDELMAVDELKKRSRVLLSLAASGKRNYREVADVIHRYYVNPNRVYEEAMDVLSKLKIGEAEKPEAS